MKNKKQQRTALIGEGWESCLQSAQRHTPHKIQHEQRDSHGVLFSLGRGSPLPRSKQTPPLCCQPAPPCKNPPGLRTILPAGSSLPAALLALQAQRLSRAPSPRAASAHLDIGNRRGGAFDVQQDHSDFCRHREHHHGHPRAPSPPAPRAPGRTARGTTRRAGQGRGWQRAPRAEPARSPGSGERRRTTWGGRGRRCANPGADCRLIGG